MRKLNSKEPICYEIQPQALSYQPSRIIDNEYLDIKHAILGILGNHPKSIQLRIKAWIHKFQAVPDNQLWKKNRNLSAKTLLLMTQKNDLTFPFDKMPPNATLPTLSLYQIPYDIRAEVESHYPPRNQNLLQYDKQNQTGNKLAGNLGSHRLKQKYSLQNKQTHKCPIEQNQSEQYNNEITQQISQLMRKGYDYILKNIKDVDKKQQAQDLLEEVWNFSNLNNFDTF